MRSCAIAVQFCPCGLALPSFFALPLVCFGTKEIMTVTVFRYLIFISIDFYNFFSFITG